MSIGTSLGNYYDDEHHMAAVKSKVGGNVTNYDNVGVVIDPGAPGTGLTQDQNEFTLEGDLNNQPGLVRQASDVIDINPMITTESGVQPMLGGPQMRRPANDNIPDLNNPNMTKVEQLARKLGETENGPGSWDRIGGGGQDHYIRDARKALRNDPDAGINRKAEQQALDAVDLSWKKMVRKGELGDQMSKMRDTLETRDWTEIELAKYNKLGREFHGDKWTNMPFEMDE